MTIKCTKHILAAAALAFTGSVFAQDEQPVTVNTDGLSATLAEKVKEKAQQGPTELRRFVERTRMIYGMHYGSIVEENTPSAIARSDKAEKVAANADTK